MLCSDYSSLGTCYQMGDYIIHGLSLWKALQPRTEVRNSEPVFACWRRLIGLPILAFLDLYGIHTSVTWFESKPLILTEFGAAKWQLK